MLTKSYLVPLLMILTGAAPATKAPCKPIMPGALYPWQTSEIMKGDQWGNFYVDLDKKGHPINCHLGDNNIKDEELGYYSCNALMRDGQYAAIIKDGQPSAGTVKRFLMTPGRAHIERDAAARKAFFRDHPEEQTSCYPD